MPVKVTTPKGDTMTYEGANNIDVAKEGHLHVHSTTTGTVAIFAPGTWTRADTVDPTKTTQSPPLPRGGSVG